MMLERTGTVVRREAGHVEVQLDAVDACAGCAGTGGCGIGPLVNALRRRPEACVLSLPDAVKFQPGERVRLCLPAPRMLRAAAVAYGLPLVGLFSGAWLVSGFAPSAVDLWAAGGALGGLAAGLLAGRQLVKDGDEPCLLPADPLVVPAS